MTQKKKKIHVASASGQWASTTNTPKIPGKHDSEHVKLRSLTCVIE